MLYKPNMKASFKKAQEWELKQPNDHTSIVSPLPYSLTKLISLEPSIPDESTADKSVNEILLNKEEHPRAFGDDPTVANIMRELPSYTPMNVPFVKGKPNLPPGDYNPLQLFLLFFDWPLLHEICSETDSFAARQIGSQWKSLTSIELLWYFGCLIKMGLYTQVNRKYLWTTHAGPLSGCPLSKNRFEQITKYIHYRDRGPEAIIGEDWWKKLGSVLPNLRAKCARYWIPGSNLTVDEIMLKFEGRTSQKVTIPGKPTSQGLKDFALANDGYVLSWVATRSGKNEDLNDQDHTRIAVDLPPNPHQKSAYLTNTQAVVAQLLDTVLTPYLLTRGFHIYLDNLFVCWRMCSWAKNRNIAITGTCRKAACGYPPRLTALKAAQTAFKWGATQAFIVHGVLCWYWQDAGGVMGTIISILIYRPGAGKSRQGPISN
jgi:hypothetical protein